MRGVSPKSYMRLFHFKREGHIQGPVSGSEHSVSLGRWPEWGQGQWSHLFKEPASTNNLEKAGRGFFPQSLWIIDY